MGETGKENCAGEQNNKKNKPEARIKVQPITDGVLLFQKYYPYTSAARGRLIGCQKQPFRFKSHTAKIVNILVFAWSAKSAGNFIVYEPG